MHAWDRFTTKLVAECIDQSAAYAAIADRFIEIDVEVSRIACTGIREIRKIVEGGKTSRLRRVFTTGHEITDDVRRHLVGSIAAREEHKVTVECQELIQP